MVVPASVQEREGAKLLLKKAQENLQASDIEIIWVDGGYSGRNIRRWVKYNFGCKFKVVKRKKVKGFMVLPKRWIVERTNAWMMLNRRLCRNYEWYLDSAEAWIYLTNINIVLHRIAA